MLLQEKILLNPNKAIAELCKRKLFYFVQEFWDVIIPEKPVYNWHIELICNEVQQIFQRVIERKSKEFDYYIFNVPPGSSKTTIVTQMATVWGWIKDPSLRYICTTYADRLSEQSAYKVQLILQSEKFKKYFSHIKIRGGISDIKNNYNGQRYITSTGGTITGVHAHIKIVDDPLNLQDAYSIPAREQAFKHITEALGSRNVNHSVTPTIIIMQRLHEDDPTGKLLNLKGLKIKHICLPSELNEKLIPIELKDKYVNGLLDPVRFDKNVLQNKKIELGSYGYAGQFLQSPAPIDGGILKKGWFEIIDEAIPENEIINFQCDTAYTAKQENDPSVILSYYKKDNTIYITNIERGWFEFNKLIDAIKTFSKNNRYSYQSKIYIEPKSSGKSIVQQLRILSELNVVEDRSPTEDKLTRANLIVPKAESMRIKLHRGIWNDLFLKEITIFPNGSHDDMLDCLVAIVIREIIDKKDFRIKML